MSEFDRKRALYLKKKLLDSEEVMLDIGAHGEPFGELLMSKWGYFGAIDRITELEDYIINDFAGLLIAGCDKYYSHNGEEPCLNHCMNGTEDCPDLEQFKTQARERLEARGVI